MMLLPQSYRIPQLKTRALACTQESMSFYHNLWDRGAQVTMEIIVVEIKTAWQGSEENNSVEE